MLRPVIFRNEIVEPADDDTDLNPCASSFPSTIFVISLQDHRRLLFGGFGFEVGKNMAELTLLCPKIVNIGIAGLNLQRHPLLHFQSVAFETRDFARIVGQKRMV